MRAASAGGGQQRPRKRREHLAAAEARAQKGGRAGWMERDGRELAVGIRALSDGRAKAAISGAGTVDLTPLRIPLVS